MEKQFVAKKLDFRCLLPAPRLFPTILFSHCFDWRPGLPDFPWCNILKEGEMYQIAAKYTKWQ
jgi:hypothetical protein